MEGVVLGLVALERAWEVRVAEVAVTDWGARGGEREPREPAGREMIEHVNAQTEARCNDYLHLLNYMAACAAS